MRTWNRNWNRFSCSKTGTFNGKMKLELEPVLYMGWFQGLGKGKNWAVPAIGGPNPVVPSPAEAQASVAQDMDLVVLCWAMPQLGWAVPCMGQPTCIF